MTQTLRASDEDVVGCEHIPRYLPNHFACAVASSRCTLRLSSWSTTALYSSRSLAALVASVRQLSSASAKRNTASAADESWARRERQLAEAARKAHVPSLLPAGGTRGGAAALPAHGPMPQPERPVPAARRAWAATAACSPAPSPGRARALAAAPPQQAGAAWGRPGRWRARAVSMAVPLPPTRAP